MDYFSFFDDFNSMFDRITNQFTRPVKDQNPFSVYSSDKGYVIVCNTLGLGKDDVKVNVAKEKGCAFPLLTIHGEKKIEKINFSNNVNLKIRLRLEEEIESVTYEVKDGLTYVYLKTKVEKPDTIEAVYKDDAGASLDW